MTEEGVAMGALVVALTMVELFRLAPKVPIRAGDPVPMVALFVPATEVKSRPRFTALKSASGKTSILRPTWPDGASAIHSAEERAGVPVGGWA